jgi:hypothetical protein
MASSANATLAKETRRLLRLSQGINLTAFGRAIVGLR